ncbi:MAG TPA: MmcQ/YjbR family DNA-binding protein [Gaiellaceae bacterium]|jgi:Uncharacterized protein conserved in bacteria|nr:MmcQ/YjbR family DNA-binding protein [Gaiellaceae bacterium]
MIVWDDVVALGRELPETEESTSYGRPSLKVRGKSFVTIRERPDALVVRCDGDEKPFLLEARPDLVFTTPHYDGYPYVLVRLEAPLEEARELVIDSWLLVAPKKLAAEIADSL